MPSQPSAPRRPAAQSTSRKKQIEEVLDVLYRRRWIVAATLLAVLAGTAAFVLTRTPLYQTSAFVLVDLGRSSASNAAGSPVVESDLFVRDGRTIGKELFILNASRGIRERVNERLEAEMGEVPEGNVSFSQASRDVASAIQITAMSRDPEAASALANAFAEEYVNQTQISSRSYLTTTREFLEEQASRLREELDAAEGQVAGQMAASGTASMGTGALVNQLSGLRAQRDAAQIQLRTRQFRLESINDQLSDIEPRLAERMSSNTERRMTQIEANLAEQEQALRVFTDRQAAGEPTDVAAANQIRQRIAELEREKQDLSGQFIGEVMGAGGIAAPQQALSYVTDLKGTAAQEQIEISAMQGSIGQLNQRIAELQGELSRAPTAVTALERVSRDRAHAAQMYESVVSQLQAVKIQEESEPGYARVLRAAPTRYLPVGAPLKKSLAFALLGGLGLGLVLALARDKVDNRVHKPEHVSALGLPVLEAIPDLAPTIRDEYDGAETIEVGGRSVVSELVTLHSPLSPASETYRHLRTAVQFSRPDVMVRTIVVSSAAAGEGKSTTAANLAVTFAQAGRKTVLIDADIRRPRVHDVFGVPTQPGLAQVLEVGQTEPDTLQVWLDGSFKSTVDDLYIVPTGAIAVETAVDLPEADARARVTNPSELLGSGTFRQLLEDLKEVVDVVIIDTPPVLAATDAVLLSTQADATLLVASAGKTKAGDIEQAFAHLNDVGARVIGAALNRFSLKNALGYAYTYGHYSRYGPYSKYGPYAEAGKAGQKRRRLSRLARRGASGDASDSNA
ncbi:MAG: polysaccharide biosynthesis tyrosine autokinase [Bacteroidota bacterium]